MLMAMRGQPSLPTPTASPGLCGHPPLEAQAGKGQLAPGGPWCREPLGWRCSLPSNNILLTIKQNRGGSPSPKRVHSGKRKAAMGKCRHEHKEQGENSNGGKKGDLE